MIATLSSTGVVEAPASPIFYAMFKILETHFETLYLRRELANKLCYFILFWIWSSWLWWLFRLPLLGVFGYGLFGNHRYAEKVRECADTLLVSCFDGRRDHASSANHTRFSSRFYSFVAGVLTLWLAVWMKQYSLCKILSLLPLFVTEIETLTSATDQVCGHGGRVTKCVKSHICTSQMPSRS
jgi:hypothetical protein